MLVEDDEIKKIEEEEKEEETEIKKAGEEAQEKKNKKLPEIKENDSEVYKSSLKEPKEVESSNLSTSSSNPGDGSTSKDGKGTKIYRKSSNDGNLILFLPQRYLFVSEKFVEPIIGVALIHQSLVSKNLKVFAQVILLFRYGREDEEMMGIRFCNEIVMVSEQIYPSLKSEPDPNSIEFKISKTGFVTVPIKLQLNSSAPPSIRLHPCRPYSGSPIGTNYEVQVFASAGPDIVPKPQKMICMSVQVHESVEETQESPSISSPNVSLEKHFLLSDNNVKLNISLNKNNYVQTEQIKINVHLHRSKGGHSVKRLKFVIVQQVDVAMFSNGSFKNYLGALNVDDLNSNEKSFSSTYEMEFLLQKEYSWLAVQEKYPHKTRLQNFAPSVVMAKSSIFVIKVHYFVQVTVSFGLLKRDVHIKIPFILKGLDHVNPPESETQ